jgi:cyclic pyranopterin phosphate synthase
MENGGVVNSFKLRIALSGLCNYRCIFCHNEGRGNEYQKQFLEVDEVLRLCAGAYKAGLRSFTFTGGEPLRVIQAVR